MNSTWLDNKAKTLLAAAITGSFGPLLLAWNGGMSWHVAIGIAAGASVTAFLGWLVPGYNQGGPKVSDPVDVPPPPIQAVPEPPIRKPRTRKVPPA